MKINILKKSPVSIYSCPPCFMLIVVVVFVAAAVAATTDRGGGGGDDCPSCSALQEPDHLFSCTSALFLTFACQCPWSKAYSFLHCACPNSEATLGYVCSQCSSLMTMQTQMEQFRFSSQLSHASCRPQTFRLCSWRLTVQDVDDSPYTILISLKSNWSFSSIDFCYWT